MAADELHAWVQKNLARGYTEKELRDTLVRYGYDRKGVKRFFRENYPAGQDRTFGKLSLTMGINSIIFSVIFLGALFGVMGIIFHGVQKKRGHTRHSRTGLLLSIIGICLSGAAFIGSYLYVRGLSAA
ncbi:hypothetical protein GF351_01160 [Candidatus Woesearchaeota archaeon]|nr:hypothetical protein [Candidatus Woesearchaeota archaeon]